MAICSNQKFVESSVRRKDGDEDEYYAAYYARRFETTFLVGIDFGHVGTVRSRVASEDLVFLVFFASS